MALEPNTLHITKPIVVQFSLIESINKLNEINDLADISIQTKDNIWKVNLESPVIKKIITLLSKFPDLKREYDVEFSTLFASFRTKHADERTNEEDNKITNDLAVLLDKYIRRLQLLNLVPPPPVIKPSATALFTQTGAIASFIVRKEPVTPEKKAELYAHTMRHMHIINADKVGLSRIKSIADILYTDRILELIDDTLDGGSWVDLPGDFIREYKALKKYLRKYGKQVGPTEPLVATAKYIIVEHTTYTFTSELYWNAFLYDMNTLYLQYYQMVRYAHSVLLPCVYRLSEQNKEIIADLQFQLRQRDGEIFRLRTEMRNATVRGWDIRNTRKNNNTKNNNTKKSNKK
jgi:hypothetical protein